VSNLLPTLLIFLQDYGYPSLWISVFVAAIGVPLPISLMLLAAGAFAAMSDFNIVLLFILSFSALVCGDNVGYLIGRRWGSKPLDWVEDSQKWKRLIPAGTIARSRNYFQKCGWWAIFLSRFLFSALGGVINLLSGSELYPYRYFLLSDISGEALGALIPLLLGYIFGASWEAVGDVLGYSSFLILSVLVVILLATRLLRSAQSLEQEKTVKNSPLEGIVDSQVAPPAKTSTGSSGNLPLL
jgi:membrane-associated protein